jgi:hypothetical protein
VSKVYLSTELGAMFEQIIVSNRLRPRSRVRTPLLASEEET